MYTIPLAAVNETELLRKYRKFILRAVFEFRVRCNISKSHPMYDDLVLEAQIAFLDECRKQMVDSLDLTAWQHACVKKRMLVCMRVFFWKAHNMGGYNTKAIDYSRSYTFTDFESESNNEFEDRVPSYNNIDDTQIDLEAFCKTLPQNLQSVIGYIIAGHNNTFIAEKLNVSVPTIGKWRMAAGNLYKNYLAATA